MPPVLETPRLKHFRTTREWGCLGHSAPLPPPPVSVSGVADAEDVKVYVLRVPTTPRTGCRATCASQGSREQNTAVCRKVTVVKNELRLGSMVGAYEQKRTAVEELTDQWIAALRRKAVIKRKKVHSAHPAPCSPPPCTAASCIPDCSFCDGMFEAQHWRRPSGRVESSAAVCAVPGGQPTSRYTALGDGTPTCIPVHGPGCDGAGDAGQSEAEQEGRGALREVGHDEDDSRRNGVQGVGHEGCPGEGPRRAEALPA